MNGFFYKLTYRFFLPRTSCNYVVMRPHQVVVFIVPGYLVSVQVRSPAPL